MKWKQRICYAPDTGGGAGGGGASPQTDPEGQGTGKPQSQGGASQNNLFPNYQGGQSANPTIDLGAFAKNAAAEANAALLKELGYSSVDELRAGLSGRKRERTEPSPDLEEKNKRIAQLEGEIGEREVNESIMRALYGQNVQDVDIVKTLIRSRLVMKDGAALIKDELGNIRYNRNGDKLSISEFLESLKTEKPYLFKEEVKPGAGIAPGGGFMATGTDVNADEILGRSVLSMDDLEKVFPSHKKK